MGLFKGWDNAYTDYIHEIEHNQNRERHEIVCAMLGDAASNPQKWSLAAWDARVLTSVLEQYQQGNLDPAQVREIFTSGGPLGEARFAPLRDAFAAIIDQNISFEVVCKTYRCSEGDVASADPV